MANDAFSGFDPALLKFLRQLKQNNNKPWFDKNKSRYENDVLFPALAFVESFGPRLKKISPFFKAVPKRMGGSVMRVYRDTRFSKDKTPYKTNLGIHFRHEMGGDVHAPGFYIHIEPKSCFLGAGIWHPDSASLKMIRAAIDEEPAKWKRARDNKKFAEVFELAGDSLKKPPRGFDPDHAMIEDLKRKDFIGVQALDPTDITDKNSIDDVARAFTATKPFMRFLCDAVQVPF